MTDVFVIRNGMRVNVTRAQRRQHDRAVEAQARRRSAVTVTRTGERTVVRRKPKSRNDWSEQTRALACQRSGGMCELCQSAVADHLHHRQSRRSRDHRIVNALHTCASCHGLIHAEPKRAVLCGWIVHSRANPAEVPVLLLGRRVLLTDVAGVVDVAA